MSLEPPSLWIEPRGRQHRVYWRNGVHRLLARSYVAFYGRAEAEQFITMACPARPGHCPPGARR